MTALTQEIVRELLAYDPSTGILTWRARGTKWFSSPHRQKIWNTRFAGQVAGSVNNCGYVIVCIFNKRHVAQRIIWLWVTGEWPDYEIDHQNHTGSDNRWPNLRRATHSQNMKNMSRLATNKSGVTGVSWHRVGKKWRASIVANGRPEHLGLFDNKVDAIAARKAAEARHGFHANHGEAA